MGRKGIYDNSQLRKKVRHDYSYARQIANQTKISDDVKRVKQQNDIVHSFNKIEFDNGMNWFNNGFSLDEAPVDMKNNASFVGGYVRAKRIKSANELSYNTGIEYYDKGVPFEEIPIMYKKNEFFMSGYNSRRNKSLNKAIINKTSY